MLPFIKVELAGKNKNISNKKKISVRSEYTVSIGRIEGRIIVTRLGRRPGRNLGKTNDGNQWCDMTTRLCILRLTLT